MKHCVGDLLYGCGHSVLGIYSAAILSDTEA
jgi:hypothetical protein